jgi:hypothetical protein
MCDIVLLRKNSFIKRRVDIISRKNAFNEDKKTLDDAMKEFSSG